MTSPALTRARGAAIPEKEVMSVNNQLTRIFRQKMACVKVEDLRPGYFLDRGYSQQVRGIVRSVYMPATESMNPVMHQDGGNKLCITLEGRESPVTFCVGDIVVATDPGRKSA